MFCFHAGVGINEEVDHLMNLMQHCFLNKYFKSIYQWDFKDKLFIQKYYWTYAKLVFLLQVYVMLLVMEPLCS